MLFNLRTTGTLVVGMTDISDIIASTNEAGVTSYDKFRTESLAKSLHSSSAVVFAPVATKSSGSPMITRRILVSVKEYASDRYFATSYYLRDQVEHYSLPNSLKTKESV